MAFHGQIQSKQIQIEAKEKEIKKGLELFLKQENRNLEVMEKTLSQLNPVSLLKRGYTRTEMDGKPIDLVKPKQGDTIQTITSNQRIKSTITEIKNS